MKLSRSQRIAVAVAVASVVAVSGGLAVVTLLPEGPCEGRLVVVTSFYPVWEFASRVAGEGVCVEMLVPANAEPHEWEPTPGDVARVAEADLVIYLHPDFETFVPAILGSLGTPPPAVVAADGLDLLAFGEHPGEEEDPAHDDEVDPHIWLDPLLMVHVVNLTRDGLSEVDPGFAAQYEANAAFVTDQLEALHAEFQTGLAHCELDVFITAHGAFRYLALRYGLTVESISVDPEVEPSPARIEELIELARSLGITVIFVEPLVPMGAAQAIADEVGGRTALLDPLESVPQPDLERGPNFFTLMRNNLESLRDGLRCA